MRWFRKVNKGFVALILVLIGLITYRTVLHQNRMKEASTLERLVEDYLATAMTAEFIPEALMETYVQSGDTADAFVESSEYQEYYGRIKSSLVGFYPSDGKYLGFTMNRLESKWLEQLQSRSIPTFKYAMDRIEDINFLDDQAALQIVLTYDIDYGENKIGSNMFYEDILFIKVDGEWKVLNADFYTNSMSGGWYW